MDGNFLIWFLHLRVHANTHQQDRRCKALHYLLSACQSAANITGNGRPLCLSYAAAKVTTVPC
jgi:hypothetical protein